MTQLQKELLLNFAKNLKQLAIRNQHYETAAFSRDIEKTLGSQDFKTQTEDAEKYYDWITKIFKEKYTFSSISNLELSDFKKQHEALYEQIYRQEIRQKLITQILKDEGSQNNLDSES